MWREWECARACEALPSDPVGRVRTYTTCREVVEDPICQEVLEQAARGAGARAAEMYAAVFSQGFADLAARWIATGKQRRRELEHPYGYVALGVLTFLAQRSMRATSIAETDGECLIEAVLPRNLLTVQGEFVVRLHAAGERVDVDAAVTVPGQLYDWGRANRTLTKLFATLDVRAAEFADRDL